MRLSPCTTAVCHGRCAYSEDNVNEVRDPLLQISSLQNPRVKAVVRLRDRRGRDRDPRVLIEGYRAVLRAHRAGYPIDELYVCEELFQGENEPALIASVGAAGASVFATTEAVFRKMAYRDRPEGLLAVGPQQPRGLDDLTLRKTAPLLLVAESIEKPGNLGTMLRTADAVGADALIVCDPCTDLYNPNVVRASTGNLFTVQIAQADNRTAVQWLRAHSIRILAASPHAAPLYWDVDLTGPLAMVVGAEQIGLSDLWMDAADVRVRLPMQGVADSLNVATATALLLYEAVRQRMAAGVVVDRGPVREDE